ncbi:spore coat protein JC [Anaerobacterium chartisolvens]|uniref:Spore coat protein JC n=1 Tax=Anaerobacterium chartisolvens TaxID=1297424 RepID=A0A369AZW5_9FIRM|nr:spore coat protein JC [Anaerobacterium chartisolvens]
MWVYEKKLEYPIKIKCPNPRMAKYIITQYGGPDGELAASIRYLSQRFSMPTNEAKGILAKWIRVLSYPCLVRYR